MHRGPPSTDHRGPRGLAIACAVAGLTAQAGPGVAQPPAAAEVLADARAATTAARKLEADALSRQGVTLHLRGDHEAALPLFLRAQVLDPAPEYLYSAGRTAQALGLFALAEASYAEVMDTSRPDHPLRLNAAHFLDQVRVLRAQPEGPGAACALPAAVTVLEADVTTARRRTGWALVAAGTAQVGAAAWVAWRASVDQAELDANRDPATNLFRSERLTLDNAQRWQRSVNQRLAGAAVLGLVGLGAASVGAWWLASQPEPPRWTLAPRPDGVAIVGGF